MSTKPFPKWVPQVVVLGALWGLAEAALGLGLEKCASLASGSIMTGVALFFIGASWTPMADPVDFRPINLMKKVNAGADFIQTQGIYDIEGFRSQMAKIRNMGLHERTAILGGIIVPKSAMMLKYMDSSVAGVSVPKSLIDRMNKAKAAAGDDKKKARELQEQEGIKITIELIHQVLETPGVKGVHIQAIEWESVIEGIVKQAGLYPRPQA
mgnify:CR=1 FL=1